jgi:4-amino-4-deoxy-L-arabinose transferase-like glycosyltransferase
LISQALREGKASHKLLYELTTIVFFFFLFLISFSRSMNKSISHDEYQFIASGQLLAERGLLPYRDYPFLHTPYIAIVNAFTALLSTYDMLMARAFNSVFGIISALLIYHLAKLILPNTNTLLKYVIGLLSAFLLVTDPIFIITDGRALNHALPTMLSLLAFILYCIGNRTGRSARMNFYCGLLVGFAMGVRLTYAVLIVAFGLAVFIYPFNQEIRSRLRNVLIFGSGVFLILLPIFFLFLIAPDQFIYGNYIYPRLNPIYRTILLHAEVMTVVEKVQYFFETVLNNPVDILIYSATLIYSFVAFIKLLRHKDQFHFEAVFAAGLSLVLFLTAFAPTPTQPQYYFAPLPFLLIVLLYGISEVSPNKPVLSIALLIFTFTLIVFNGTFSKIAVDIAGLRHPEDWQPVQLHNFALKIKTLVPEGKVLTLAPIIPLEAGLDTYEMFAVGPFSWRTAQLLGEQKRKEYRIISYEELDTFLKANPPTAILIGVEANYEGFQPGDDGGLERPFLNYAIQSGYKPIEFPTDFAGIPTTLYIRQNKSN